MNLLAKRKVAIVSDTPGTTRDILTVTQFFLINIDFKNITLDFNEFKWISCKNIRYCRY